MTSWKPKLQSNRWDSLIAYVGSPLLDVVTGPVSNATVESARQSRHPPPMSVAKGGFDCVPAPLGSAEIQSLPRLATHILKQTGSYEQGSSPFRIRSTWWHTTMAASYRRTRLRLPRGFSTRCGKRRRLMPLRSLGGLDARDGLQ